MTELIFTRANLCKHLKDTGYTRQMYMDGGAGLYIVAVVGPEREPLLLSVNNDYLAVVNESVWPLRPVPDGEAITYVQGESNAD